MSSDAYVQGHCDSRFEAVKTVFELLFATGKELGAALSIWIDGKPVIDLWGGYADAQQTRPWRSDTLVNVFSNTKAFSATCVHRLVETGRLNLDRPACDYWPEFARAGKAAITLRQILSHQAGLPSISQPLPAEALFDWQVMTEALSQQAPLWPPGTIHGYHARTYGWLLGEIVRRTAGRSLGTFCKEEISGPLGLDFHIGLDPSQFIRVADMQPIPAAPKGTVPNMGHEMVHNPKGLTARAFTNPPLHEIHDAINTPEWRQAEIPSSNGHCTANSLAKFYSALACGGSLDGYGLLRPETIEHVRTEQVRGPDAVLLLETRFGLGFMLPVPDNNLGPNERAFGHPGMGGSLGFADPEAGVGFGYTLNKSGYHILVDDRPAALINAFYECL